MGFIAKDNGGGNFKQAPPGVYVGRCYSMIDLGTQITNGQFGEKAQYKVRIGWELFGEDEKGEPLTININGKQMPLTISKSYTLSMHEKSGLRKDLAAWRGRAFDDEEAKAFDVSKLLGAYGLVNVTVSQTNGKTYTNVAGLSPLPGALAKQKPEPVHETVVFNLDEPDMNVFATFHEKLQEAIKRSPEWNKAMNASAPQDTSKTSFDDMDDDIPF